LSRPPGALAGLEHAAEVPVAALEVGAELLEFARVALVGGLEELH
jgi:hypothetical protein